MPISHLFKKEIKRAIFPTMSCSVTRLGNFLKVLVNKFAYKSSPIRLVTFGLFRNRSIYVKTAVDII